MVVAVLPEGFAQGQICHGVLAPLLRLKPFGNGFTLFFVNLALGVVSLVVNKVHLQEQFDGVWQYRCANHDNNDLRYLILPCRILDAQVYRRWPLQSAWRLGGTVVRAGLGAKPLGGLGESAVLRGRRRRPLHQLAPVQVGDRLHQLVQLQETCRLHQPARRQHLDRGTSSSVAVPSWTCGQGAAGVRDPPGPGTRRKRRRTGCGAAGTR